MGLHQDMDLHPLHHQVMRRQVEVYHPLALFQGQPVHKSAPTIVTTVVPLGPHPTHMICPHCHVEIESTTKREPGIVAYISGIIIFLMGCWCGCCLIPCCIDSCVDVHHDCPNCGAYLGRFRR
uniref:Cell death-inducing p53-target protein 1 n=1 Tax=Triatoma infestans TaxID=30076 RepID=A0A171ASQ7_TRIIF